MLIADFLKLNYQGYGVFEIACIINGNKNRFFYVFIKCKQYDPRFLKVFLNKIMRKELG